MGAILPIIILLPLFWLFLVRPQKQRVDRQRQLLASLEVGDQVVTAGGLVGTIETIDEEYVQLKVATGVVLTLVRQAIARRTVGADADADADVENENPA
jgi:preprotein translocase subunit YajC